MPATLPRQTYRGYDKRDAIRGTIRENWQILRRYRQRRPCATRRASGFYSRRSSNLSSYQDDYCHRLSPEEKDSVSQRVKQMTRSRGECTFTNNISLGDPRSFGQMTL
ncbi:hypothetical protein QLX08_003754 [Tetragonisca angustula]|uniref:Uncharacterized protein n=1 Tax=Tetragonisca angustula TaxID=166442 RepID=A0AAW1A5A5_9HYME